MTCFLVAGFEAPFGGRFYPTHHDARYPSSVTVYYPLHPLYDQGELHVRQRHGSGDGEQYVVDGKLDTQAVAVWMTDKQRCAQMTIGLDPQCSLGSYLALLSLIRSVDL